jgi:putative membrane protein
MSTKTLFFVTLTLCLAFLANGFTSNPTRPWISDAGTQARTSSNPPLKNRFTSRAAALQGQKEDCVEIIKSFESHSVPHSSFAPATIVSIPILLTALPAYAAGSGGGVIPSALFAYGHYVMLLIAMGLLVYERVTIQPNMSQEQEKSAAIADALYLLTFAAIVGTGASRTIDYGKDVDFYIHEPFFWVKMALVGVQGGIGAFPALTHIRRAKGVFGNDKLEPLSEKLSTRLHKVINAEITGILSIPFMATFMARGVGYSQEFPWQAGAALTGLALLGSSAAYAKQALTWTEDDVALPTAEQE